MNSTNDGLSLEGDLSVSLHSIDTFPKDGQFSLINDCNETLLKTSLALNETLEIDEHDEIRLELRRQDLKINLLLEMVADLLAKQNSIPLPSFLKLTASSLECSPENCNVQAGDKVEIELYITPASPKPLKLYGVVQDIAQDIAQESAQKSTLIHFVGISQTLQDWLEKIIFRHHRRTIALARV